MPEKCIEWSQKEGVLRLVYALEACLWLGLKKVVYLSTLLSKLAFLVYFGAGLNLIPAVGCSVIGSYLTGVWLATSGALGLLQEGTFRGSMMSLTTASSSLGGVLGAMVGGFALLCARAPWAGGCDIDSGINCDWNLCSVGEERVAVL
jgi:hypothetical protein